MEQRKQKKPVSGGAKALIVVLTVLAVLVGLPFLYLSIGFPTDDLEAAAESALMSSKERYAFHADDATVDMAVEPTDLWWIVKQGGALTELDDIQQTLAKYGLTVKKQGIRFEEGEARLNVKLLYKGFLPLPVQARFALSNSGETLTARLTKLYLGRLIPIDSGKLPFDKRDLTVETDLSEIHSRFRQLTNVSVADGRLILTTRVGAELAAEMLQNFGQVETSAMFLGEFEAIDVARAVQQTPYGAAFTNLLKACEANVDAFIEFKRSELAAAEDFKAVQYFTKPEGYLLARFLPELTKENMQALSDRYRQEQQEREDALLTLCRNLQNWNLSGQLSTDGVQFLNLAQGGAPLTFQQLSPDEESLSAWLDLSAARVVYGSGGSAAMTYNLPILSRMPKATPNAFTGLRGNGKYVPVILLSMVNGRTVLACMVEEGKLYLKDVTEEEYAAMMGNPRIPAAALDLEYYE